jgi:hypothetical protein
VLIKLKQLLVDGVGVGEDEPTTIDPKICRKLKYLFWKVREFFSSGQWEP